MRSISACLLCLAACMALAAQDPFTLSVDVDMILFNMNVTDNKGRAVSGLTKENFKVYEDGREQAIHSFQAEDNPATVGLIIDNSGSMSNKRAAVVEAAFVFLRESNPSDEVFIVNFNDYVWKGLPESVQFSNDIGQLRASLLGTRAAGRTALYDAIASGLQHVVRGSRQRKALVVMSDGGDNASHATRDDVIDLIRKSNATVYTIGIYDPSDSDKNPGVLKNIAKAGGGEAYLPHELSELPNIWQKIALGIRGQYTIGYFSNNPKQDGEFRKVKITAADSSGRPLRVRTRDGYRARQ